MNITLMFAVALLVLRVALYAARFWETPLVSGMLLPGVILFSFFLVLFLAARAGKQLSEPFYSVSRKSWLILFAIFLLALLLRVFMSGFQHLVLWDEFLHLNTAESLITTHRLGVCIFGAPSQPCELLIHSQYPGGYPVLLALMFSVFGISEAGALVFSVCLSALSAVLIFLLAYVMFRSERIALSSALLLSLVPVLIIFSSTTTPNATSLFFILLSMFFSVVFMRKRSFSLLALSCASLVFTSYIRHENTILLFSAIPLALLYYSGRYEELFDVRKGLFFLLLALLMSPLLVVLQVNLSSPYWWSPDLVGLVGKSAPDIVQQIIARTISFVPKHASFWFGASYHPLLFSVLFLAGCAFGLAKHRHQTLLLLSWFSLFFFFLIVFWPPFSYTDVRHAVIAYVPFVLLCSLGVEWLLEVSGRKRPVLASAALAVFIFILLATFFLTMKNLPLISHPVNLATARAMHSGSSLDESCYVISYAPYAVISSMTVSYTHLTLPTKRIV